MPSKKPECLTPGCDETLLLARGLCESCYRAAARMVRLKRKTWAELEKRKLAKPAHRGHKGGKMFQLLTSKK